MMQITNWREQLWSGVCPKSLYPFNEVETIGKEVSEYIAVVASMGFHRGMDHCLFDDGPVKVSAPKDTSPHLNLSGNGERVVFRSSMSGVS